MRKLIIIPVIVAFLALCPGLARGSADTGFRPDRDGFGFANFGDAVAIGGVDLNALAGTSFHDEIFSHTGHCFGMAEASVENFEGGKASISIPAEEAIPYIDRIQTGQSFFYIGDFLRQPFGGKPQNNAGEYLRLSERLSAGRPAVIGIYPSGGGYPGHAVVAYRIERDGEKSDIYIYDPNLPATLHDYDAYPVIAVFDAADGTFLYDNGRAFDEMRLDDLDGTGIAMPLWPEYGYMYMLFSISLLPLRFSSPPIFW